MEFAGSVAEEVAAFVSLESFAVSSSIVSFCFVCPWLRCVLASDAL